MSVILKSVVVFTLLNPLAKPESCVVLEPNKLEKSAKVCRLIFRGKVINAVTEDSANVTSSTITTYQILPSKIWRGLAKDTITFKVNECGTKLNIGDECIILTKAEKVDKRHSNEQTIVANVSQETAKLDFIFSRRRFQKFKVE